MSDPSAVWHPSGAGEKRRGPFTADQIVQALRAGKIGAPNKRQEDEEGSDDPGHEDDERPPLPGEKE